MGRVKNKSQGRDRKEITGIERESTERRKETLRNEMEGSIMEGKVGNIWEGKVMERGRGMRGKEGR